MPRTCWWATGIEVGRGLRAIAESPETKSNPQKIDENREKDDGDGAAFSGIGKRGRDMVKVKIFLICREEELGPLCHTEKSHTVSSLF